MWKNTQLKYITYKIEVITIWKFGKVLSLNHMGYDKIKMLKYFTKQGTLTFSFG